MTIEPTPTTSPIEVSSVLDLLLEGGPVMIPIALSSVIAATYFVERWFGMRSSNLGTARDGERLLATWRERGSDALSSEAKGERTALSRILDAALGRVRGTEQVESAYEDAGRRELRRLNAKLRPLVVVALIAPLLGLLGTVWGMIQSFADIALKDGLGDPKILASGISQALVTTAAGLAIAIPAQAAVHWFRSRIDKFQRRLEDLWLSIDRDMTQSVEGEAA